MTDYLRIVFFLLSFYNDSMDILTHFLVGYDLSKALPLSLKYSGEALIVGAVLPDIDHIPTFINKNHYLKYHGTFIHSLTIAPLISIMLAFFIKHWERFVL